MIKTEFMELYEELSKINGEIDLESIVNDVATEVKKYDENGSNQNCLFSTWAVELQLRGENFLPRPVYSPRDPIFNIKGEELVVEPEVLKINSKDDVETQVLDAGDGARFYCHVNWADSKGGHEFLLVNKTGTVLVVDGQAGYIKEINKDKKYFDDINFENSYIVRFDNKEINQDILKYNDEDQIVEWDDELDPKLLEEDFSNNNEFLHSLLDELSEFDYAFIGGGGEELDDEDAMEAVVQSPDQLVDLEKGVCTDFVEYTRTKLDDRKISYKVYYIVCTDKDEDRPSHVFVVIENDGKFLWFEAAWHSEAGIHEYDSLEELFVDIARKHCIYDGENYLDSCEIREIKKSLVGMSQEEIYDYVDTLPITWKAAEEGITEELAPTRHKQGTEVEFNEAAFSATNRLFVVGLSGSGKSTLGKKLAEEYNGEYVELDKFDYEGNIINYSQGGPQIVLEFLSDNSVVDDFNLRIECFVAFILEKKLHTPVIIEGVQLLDFGKELAHEAIILLDPPIEQLIQQFRTREANWQDVNINGVQPKSSEELDQLLKQAYNKDKELLDKFKSDLEKDLNEEFDPPYNEQQVRANYGEEIYYRLIKDPAHYWRMKTGLELIHQEPSKEELERIWSNWQLMTTDQKRKSDEKSRELFGKTNAEHYAELIKTYN